MARGDCQFKNVMPCSAEKRCPKRVLIGQMLITKKRVFNECGRVAAVTGTNL